MHRVRENVRDEFRIEAAHPHTQQRKAVPVRGLFQGLHPVLESLPSQAHARRLSDANKVREMRTILQHGNVIVEAQTFLRLNDADRTSRSNAAIAEHGTQSVSRISETTAGQFARWFAILSA